MFNIGPYPTSGIPSRRRFRHAYQNLPCFFPCTRENLPLRFVPALPPCRCGILFTCNLERERINQTWSIVNHFGSAARRPMSEADKAGRLTLEYYDDHANSFREATRDHDVSQNIE